MENGGGSFLSSFYAFHVMWSFIRGLADSLMFTDLFFLDAKAEQDKCDKILKRNLKKEYLLNRDNLNAADWQSLARRRALDRREQLALGGGGSGSGGSSPEQSGHVTDSREPRILERTFKCCVFNGCVFWLSIVLFEQLLIPAIHWATVLLLGAAAEQWLSLYVMPLLSFLFASLWVLPLFLLSKMVNAMWFADIADVAFKKSAVGRPRLMNSLSTAVADTVFSIFVEMVFLLQGKLLTYLIPIKQIADLVNMMHLCLLHALYCFEYKWFNQGVELHRRLASVEEHWPYFMGFGLPLAVVTSWPTSQVVSGCVFSILFPLFLVSGNKANVEYSNDVPIRIFRPTIAISNAILAKLLGKRPA